MNEESHVIRVCPVSSLPCEPFLTPLSFPFFPESSIMIDGKSGEALGSHVMGQEGPTGRETTE
jgi:hypothetical protein